MSGEGIHTLMAEIQDVRLKDLDQFERHELVALSDYHSLPHTPEMGVEELKHHLRRYRDGGIPLKCPGDCDRHWVYCGDADHRTSCPNCGTSVRINANRTDADGDEE